MKKAIVTGITGQDGAWLAKTLLNNGYEVYGGMRRTSTSNVWRLEYLGILDKVKLIDLDLLEYHNINAIVRDIKPDEFYNLAAQSFVGVSFKQPITTSQINGVAVAYILDVLKNTSPKTKFYQASTSEMYGKAMELPLKETSPFYPRSPYGCAKVYAHWMTINYRESYGMFCCSGILFNHESELRGPEFVTRKITQHIAKRTYDVNYTKTLKLGNLDALRDWGYAKEYVEGMYLMMQHNKPDTYVLASGKSHSVREFVELAFREVGEKITWKGTGVNEIGCNDKDILVEVDKEFYRPAEVDVLVGDASKAKEKLGWEAKTNLEKLVKIMVKSDMKKV